jgi:hypothetical protein
MAHLHIISQDYDGIADGELLYVEDSREEFDYDCTPDEYDLDDGITAVDLAVRYITRKIPVYVEPDCMPGIPSWFSGWGADEGRNDYWRGDIEGVEYFIGLEGFTEDERAAIGIYA